MARWPRRKTLAAALAVALIMGIGWTGRPWRQPSLRWGDSGAERIVVLPFRSGAASRPESSDIMSQRVASTLSRLGLNAQSARHDDDEADYILDGRIDRDSGRVAIALSLHHHGERSPFWRATFWRPASPDSVLATDIAAAVAGALGIRDSTPRNP